MLLDGGSAKLTAFRAFGRQSRSCRTKCSNRRSTADLKVGRAVRTLAPLRNGRALDPRLREAGQSGHRQVDEESLGL